MKIYNNRNKIPADWQLVETHSHILPASQCSELDYKELIDIYESKGYSALFITDHYGKDFDETYRYFYSHSDKPFATLFSEIQSYSENKNIKIFYGFEIKFHTLDSKLSKESEFLVYGTSPDFLEKYPQIYICDNVKNGLLNLRNALHKEYGNNFLIIQAHPSRNAAGIIRNKHIDGIELFNGTTFTNPVFYTKHLFSGSDAHQPHHCGTNALLFYDWDYTLSDFINKIRKRQYHLYCQKDNSL